MPRKSKNKLNKKREEDDEPELNNGNIVDDDEEDDYETTEESEDDSAQFLTEKVEDNIFKTLLKIKNKDPEIYNNDHTFFNDSDFEVEEDEKDKGPEKPLTYSDMLRETLLKEGAEAFEEEDEVPQKGLTYNDEQSQLKKEFLEASKALDDEEFLTKSETVDEIPEFKPSKAIAASEETLDENEQFLKDYILNQRWREDRLENFKVDHSLEKIDEYDEEHLEKADEFEYKYNYRFEEQDGSKIIGYPRNIEDSARKPDERRKLKREEKKRRKMEEKVRRDEKIKRLKNIRKTAYEKMQQIASTAGVPVNPEAVDLDAPFDPEQHERDMKKIIGLGYDKDELDDMDSEEDPELWWKCDECSKGIPAGQLHYDCKACENYTLCEKCIGQAAHEHKDFSSKKVPVVCSPPDEMEESFDLDYEDYIADMPVKFKYRKVDPVPCDVNTVLEKSDKELNQMMPLRNLIGYDTPGQPKHQADFKKKSRHQSKGKKFEFKSPNKAKKYMKSMTTYNVNRDRLSAFGLEKRKLSKKKQD
ncbi:uncharacterized protein TOT_040000420 [Theileria orientalis strain Shintoku]|uniref:Kri1-like C-terminal domain-containing protein n=1 Tax=Theileria orientalis strain Shintoku TaxID=869250 RepID=J4DQ91_THEOR|nr:uncharacterized protein TOT_040000420 [Theileria orientalis strain Shintoku]BAM42044.1 uncharacterized protein TOT_040000420 [Theileria orientalis strain Shintoku]|eukprot:XP_009692345.1 uncharacterized protein TOT_040000420 [Theileria orientalis strain Shintoku]